MRIAVASIDGKDVNEHFGRARRFLIYDLTAQRTFSWLSAPTGFRSHGLKGIPGCGAE
jgi:predicted Fe-Mo cluster-binding NifX family protein